MKPQTDYNNRASKMYGLRLNLGSDRDLIEKIERWRETGFSIQELFKEALNDYFSLLENSDSPINNHIKEKMSAAAPSIPKPSLKRKRKA